MDIESLKEYILENDLIPVVLERLGCLLWKQKRVCSNYGKQDIKNLFQQVERKYQKVRLTNWSYVKI